MQSQEMVSPQFDSGFEDGENNAENASSMNVLANFPVTRFRPIFQAGSGSWGTVYLSLSEQEFDTAIQEKEANTFETLKAKLVAVKVFQKGTSEPEVQALSKLKNEVEHHGYNPHAFTLLFEYEQDWMAMRAVLPVMNLYNLYPFPREVLLHCFLELTRTGRFLHEQCTPPVGHGDLHLANIMIDLDKETPFGFPQIVLVDFGFTKEIREQHDVSTVMGSMRYVMDELKYFPEDEQSLGCWEDFSQYVYCDKDPISFKKMEDDLAEKITSTLAAVTSERKQVLRNALTEMASEREQNLEAAFRSANLLM
ncbi:hypothetical protein N0V90_001124 [Kalmusia sp. IMI 367209]|nr:hypothetical protein N0V90_001124 [Kalmusia sp. IMI 367209]